MKLSEKELQQIWDNFMIRVYINDNTDSKNFLGSIDKYKELFMKGNKGEE